MRNGYSRGERGGERTPGGNGRGCWWGIPNMTPKRYLSYKKVNMIDMIFTPKRYLK